MRRPEVEEVEPVIRCHFDITAKHRSIGRRGRSCLLLPSTRKITNIKLLKLQSIRGAALKDSKAADDRTVDYPRQNPRAQRECGGRTEKVTLNVALARQKSVTHQTDQATRLNNVGQLHDKTRTIDTGIDNTFSERWI